MFGNSPPEKKKSLLRNGDLYLTSLKTSYERDVKMVNILSLSPAMSLTLNVEKKSTAVNYN